MGEKLMSHKSTWMPGTLVTVMKILLTVRSN